jgi:hypothetical protein
MEELSHLSQDFWNNRYETNTTGWDLGTVSPPIQCYFDKIENKDLRILIPGAGNAHEADYLLQAGFNDITVIDIAPLVVKSLQEKYKHKQSIRIIQGDFFEHYGMYDIVIEQTFFCAISPSLRSQYVTKMHSLLAENGYIVGLLFNCSFEGGPPFGGNADEYIRLFKPFFNIDLMEPCRNSIKPRVGNELFVRFKKK